MPLLLKPVDPARGARWVRDAFTLFLRRPLAFTMLFVAFLLVSLFASLLPLVGGFLQLALWPLLSLGFMIASQAALLDGRITPLQFAEPLQGNAQRRRSLLLLCALFGAVALAVVLMFHAMSDGAMARLQELMQRPGGAPPEEIDALLAESGLSAAALVASVLIALLSVPFWHAPALVHWGGQGAWQALFSSTVAVWRSKGAFFVYGLCWVGLVVAFSAASALLFALLGAAQLASLVAMPALLMFSTVFYVSLLFTFNDSFGGGVVPGPSEGDEPARP